MKKYKKAVMVAAAVIFLATLFGIKNGFHWSSKTSYEEAEGLLYEDALVEDVIKRDADQDGVMDWEEILLGLDPTKKETTPGTPDITAVNSLRSEDFLATDEAGDSGTENLTETDKFSRELFSTVTALEQSGSLDQATAEKIASSLADNIGDGTPKKIYTLAELNINNETTVQKYNGALDEIYTKYPIEGNIMDILQRFSADPAEANTEVLTELTPIMEQNKKIIAGLLKIPVPQYLSSLHLNVINGLEAMNENLADIQLYDQDAIVALGGMIKYPENAAGLEKSLKALAAAIDTKLSN